MKFDGIALGNPLPAQFTLKRLKKSQNLCFIDFFGFFSIFFNVTVVLDDIFGLSMKLKMQA